MISLDFSTILHGRYLGWLISGAQMTVMLFITAWLAGFFLSLIIVSLRQSNVKILEAFATGFVGYHRNVPGLVQVFLWYFGAPQILPDAWQEWINAHNSEFILVSIALSLNTAAYMSEDLRSGMRSLPPTQLEAARALGMTYISAMRIVILPQALRASIPPLINQSLSLFKSTSLAMVVGLADITYATRQIENESFRTFETFAIASGFYWFGSFLLVFLGHVWITRLQAGRKTL